jgi:hypothetical protein
MVHESPVDILGKPKLAVALILACFFGAVVSQIGSRAAREFGWASRASPYALSREKAILSHAKQGRFPIVMLGDSFAELADLPSLCGKRVLNAGVSGATIADVERLAPKVLSYRPQIVIIAVGLNDTSTSKPTSDESFRASYLSLLTSVRKSGADVFLVGIPHVNDAHFDPQRQATLGAIVRLLGGHELPLLATDDGVHPNAAGYEKWKSIVGEACATVDRDMTKSLNPPTPL